MKSALQSGQTMSYDLDLFTPQEGIKPITIIQQAAMTSESADSIVNRALLHDISRLNQDFNVQTSPVSITMIHAESGIKISLYASSGHFSISYWDHDEDSIQAIFETAVGYLNMIKTHTGYAVYDPQLGRVVDIETDLAEMMVAYHAVHSRMESPF